MPKVRMCLKEGPGVVALTTVELPDPGPGMALVRTTLTTICGSDIHIADDIPEVPSGTPMGHEAVGVVEAVGPGVERFKPGDRVVSSCLISCGDCPSCRLGELQLCSTYGAPMNLLFGAQSEAFLVASADIALSHIPDGLDDRHAVCAADILSTGFGALERAQVGKGQSVAVFAQGPVGLCATLGAKFYGAEPIIAVESIPERVEMARRFGADLVVEEPAHALREISMLTGGRGVDIAVEAVGKQETFEACCRATRIGGVVSSVGVYSGIEFLRVPVGVANGSYVHRTIVTTLCPVGTERLDYLLRLMDTGKVDPSPLFTHERPLGEIVAAYDQFRHRTDGAIKIAIV